MTRRVRIVALLSCLSLFVLTLINATVRFRFNNNDDKREETNSSVSQTAADSNDGTADYHQQTTSSTHKAPELQNAISKSRVDEEFDATNALIKEASAEKSSKSQKNKRTIRNGFFNNHTCLTQGEPDVPSDWKRRAPHFVLLGAMKAGTEALMYYLRQHDQIVQPRDKEASFLDREPFDAFATPDGILRKSGRDRYANYMRLETLFHTKQDIQKNSSLVSSDNTPRYIMWSDAVPARLFCIAPWVKLVVLLRNPVERGFSHYTMAMNSRKQKGLDTSAFENWIKKDLRRMRDSGLIPQTMKWNSQKEYDTFAGSTLESEAWKDYTGESSGFLYHGAIVGRGLYSIQLRHWWQAMERVGKPRSDLLVLRSGEMRINPNKVVDRVLDFIGMPRFTAAPNTQEQHHGKYRSILTNETRVMLQHFFEPYNRQLYDMLGEEWDGVWD